MKIRRFFALVLMATVVGCGNISEKDLVGLEEENSITKSEAIKRVSVVRGFPLGVIDNIVDRGDREKAVQIIAAQLATRKKMKNIDIGLIKALGNLSRVVEIPVDVLIERLDDEDRQIRNAVIEALGKAKSKAAVKPFLKLLDTDIAYSAIWALGEIGSTEAVPYLNNLLVSNERWVRFNAYKALTNIGQIDVDLDDSATGTDSNPAGLGIGEEALKRYQDAMKGIFNFIVKIRGSV